MNILFTCAGRRNYLLIYFRSLGDIYTIACDESPYAPALYYADEFFIAPNVNDDDYIEKLVYEAESRKIDAIIPLNDLELPVLAAHKSEFEKIGTKVIISDKKVIEICFDKYNTSIFSEKTSTSKLPTFLDPYDALKFKDHNPDCTFILKPRWGSASIGIEYLEEVDDLVSRYELAKGKFLSTYTGNIMGFDPEKCFLIQKKLTGQEYGMDVINNLQGEHEAVLLRRKIQMRAGETDKAETIFDPRLKMIGEEIGRELKHIGNLDCDLIIENENIYLLEMNPRFGGGYPFMHFAGANLPLAIVGWLKGNNTPAGCFDYPEGCISAKVDVIVGLNR